MDTESFIKKQEDLWDLVKINYSNVTKSEYKKIHSGELTYLIQSNPGRIISSSAKIDKKALSERPCFLCKKNRPELQLYKEYKGHKEQFEILVNPFPIFEEHLTIPAKRHIPQRISGYEEDLLNLTDSFENFVIFYNGAKCGASAPDHMHFQAGNKGLIPIEKDFKKIEETRSHVKNNIYEIRNLPVKGLYIKDDNKNENIRSLKNIIKIANNDDFLNILSWKTGQNYITFIFPRKRHRPSCYPVNKEIFKDEKNKETRLISPASVEMGGLIITARKEDFKNITKEELNGIFEEVCLPEPEFCLLIEKIKNS